MAKTMLQNKNYIKEPIMEKVTVEEVFSDDYLKFLEAIEEAEQEIEDDHKRWLQNNG